MVDFYTYTQYKMLQTDRQTTDGQNIVP